MLTAKRLKQTKQPSRNVPVINQHNDLTELKLWLWSTVIQITMCYYVNEWLDNQEFIYIFAHVNILQMQN
jgi:hypothetical protein